MDELEEIREKCGAWDDEEGECMEDYPIECPFAGPCQDDAEEDTEEADTEEDEECSEDSDG